MLTIPLALLAGVIGVVATTAVTGGRAVLQIAIYGVLALLASGFPPLGRPRPYRWCQSSANARYHMNPVGSGLYAVTPYGRAGPSSRVRVWEWLDRLARPAVTSGYLGHHNASPGYISRHPVGVWYAETRLRRMAAAAPSRLILHREASPLSRGALERRLLSRAGFACYDFDDALQCDTGEGGAFRKWAPKAPKALAAVQSADRVIAGNAVLADWASGHNRDVVIIPSCVSPQDYREKSDYACSDPPRLGWIGSRDNERYLGEISPALREVHRRTGARLTLIGTASPVLGELEAIIDRVPWSEAVQAELIAGFDIGLSPMPDTPYTRGKCGYKLLQYAAAGTPVIASPIGVNDELLRRFAMPGPTGNAEWVEAIVELLQRATEDRRRLGKAARRETIEGYSYDAWLSRWRSAVGIDGLRDEELGSACADPPNPRPRAVDLRRKLRCDR